jgi:hypothetical protein
MRLSAPKQVTWIVAAIAGALGVLLHYRVLHIPVLSAYSTVLIIAAWALLLLASLLSGL